MSPKLKNSFVMILLCFMSCFSYAQDNPPPPTRMIPPPPGLPIDGSVIILLCLGILLGVVFYIKSKKAL